MIDNDMWPTPWLLKGQVDVKRATRSFSAGEMVKGRVGDYTAVWNALPDE